ncbi:MAG: phosphopantothenoylcysteine decarboxylase [Defluviitaleaceae bacterium]|nr:phosphopantothenoylcysteine decarboxylase [Defluviitaleaceae bacterium]
MKSIILGITGSIAAYKAADIANNLVNRQYNVNAVMTKAGASFITPLTLQTLTKNRVFVDVLQEDDPAQIVHIDLPQSVDILLIAPATANIIAKIATGIADDMLSSMVLATPNSTPKLIAPAMNTKMYENVATQENLHTLQKRGWQIIEPRVARLACNHVGKGALAKVDTIVNTIEALNI